MNLTQCTTPGCPCSHGASRARGWSTAPGPGARRLSPSDPSRTRLAGRAHLAQRAVAAAVRYRDARLEPAGADHRRTRTRAPAPPRRRKTPRCQKSDPIAKPHSAVSNVESSRRSWNSPTGCSIPCGIDHEAGEVAGGTLALRPGDEPLEALDRRGRRRHESRHLRVATADQSAPASDSRGSRSVTTAPRSTGSACRQSRAPAALAPDTTGWSPPPPGVAWTDTCCSITASQSVRPAAADRLA